MSEEIHNPPQPESQQQESPAAESNSAPLGTHQPRAIESPDDLANLAGEPFVEAGAPPEPAQHDPLLEATQQPLPAIQPDQDTPATRKPNRILFELRSISVAAVGWIVPGAGYLVQRRWSRALIGFLAVGAFAVLGMKMRGNVFPPHGSEPFDYLGYVADLGSGFFYFIAKTVEAAGPDVSRASGDYGTRLIATAGVLNVLLILDAIQIARGEKS
jgi:hypothetical protein